MIDDTHLDGNAIGGLLRDLFGQEMTARDGCCGHCGAINVLGAVRVYQRAPGVVVRCPACGYVLMVITTIESDYRVSFEALRWLETPM